MMTWDKWGGGRLSLFDRSGSSFPDSELRDRLHFAQAGHPLERLGLDLPYALARQAEPAADLLERLRLFVDKAVAEDQHLALALREDCERFSECLAAQRDLDLLVGQRPVAGDEI